MMAGTRTVSLDLPVASILANPRHDWDMLTAGGRLRTARNIEVDWKKFSQDNFLFSHCTIVASVDLEDDGHTIKAACNELVNNNGNAWSNEVLLATFKSFVGGENYLEHVQVPELSKGKILDAVARPIHFKGKNGEADIYYCFVGNVRVLMADGTEKEIKDIVVGDMVFSGEGKPREVLAVSNRYATDIVKLKLRGDLDLVGCTTGHKIWAKKDIADEWTLMEAGSLEHDWWVLQPKPECVGDVDISSDMAWLSGFYAAEGSIVEKADKDGIKHPKVVQFTCHQDEESIARKAIDAVLGEIGPYKVPFFTQRYSGEKLMRSVKGGVDSRKTSEFGINIRVNHSVLAEMMIGLCGRGSATKKFNTDILLYWSEDARLGFLAGLIDGDGCSRRDVVSFKSASNDMVRGVEFILSSLGMAYSTTGGWHDGPYSGCATVELDCQSSDRLRKYLRVKNAFDIWSGEVSMGNRASVACAEGIARRIASVEKVADSIEVPVYNIEVEEDHNYIVSGIKVKNCDILVATNKKHSDLVSKIASGELTTMSMGCGVAGTPILMVDGTTKPVEEVSVGEIVQTHMGRTAIVESTRVRQTQPGELRRLSLTGIPDTYVTAEHPYWTLVGYDVCIGCGKEMRRSSAKPWSIGQILHPWCSSSCKQKHDNSNPKCAKSDFVPVLQKVKFEWIPVSELRKGDYVAVPLGRSEKARESLARCKCRLLGYYAAEGNLQWYKHKKPVAVEFSLNADEPAGDEIVLLAREWGIEESKIYDQKRVRKSGRSRRIVIHDEMMAKWMLETCGEHCDGKRLAGWVMQLDDTSLLDILGSYIDGDGHCRKDTARFTTASCSKALSEQALSMMMWLGIPANISESKPKNKKPAWYVITKKGQAAILDGHTFKFRTQQKNKSSVSNIGGYMLRRVTANTPVDIVCDVYNMHVENEYGDHSYIMNGVATHNCLADYVQCSKCGKVLGDNDPNCTHLDNEMLHSYYDKKGVKRVVSELCGRTIMQGGKRVGDKKSCKFIEASWVAKPAFVGAVLNHYVSDISKDAAQILAFPTWKLSETMEEIFKMRVADRAGMLVLKVARAELLRRNREAMIERLVRG
jgi:hypothetical protein